MRPVEKIAAEIISDDGLDVQWCDCYEGDLGNAYPVTRDAIRAKIAAAILAERASAEKLKRVVVAYERRDRAFDACTCGDFGHPRRDGHLRACTLLEHQRVLDAALRGLGGGGADV